VNASPRFQAAVRRESITLSHLVIRFQLAPFWSNNLAGTILPRLFLRRSGSPAASFREIDVHDATVPVDRMKRLVPFVTW
jgi:hypothetical protein